MQCQTLNNFLFKYKINIKNNAIILMLHEFFFKIIIKR